MKNSFLKRWSQTLLVIAVVSFITLSCEKDIDTVVLDKVDTEESVPNLKSTFEVYMHGFPSSLTPSDLNKPISMWATSNQSGVSYYWSVSGGYLQSGQGTSTVKVVPGSPVTFGVYLRATNSQGEVKTVSKWIW